MIQHIAHVKRKYYRQSGGQSDVTRGQWPPYGLIFLLVVVFFSTTAKAKSYGIALNEDKVCPAVRDTLGQMLLVNVDGFGRGLETAIHPDYVKLVKLLKLGGVLPTYGKKDPKLIFAANQQLFQATEQPLLIAVDGTKANFHGPDGEQVTNIGYRSSIGWMAQYQNASHECFEQQSFLDAFLFKALGLNMNLGPVVEQNRYHQVLFKHNEAFEPVAKQILSHYGNMAIKTTLKYFPYRPAGFNRFPPHFGKRDMMNKLDIYKRLAANAEFLLTSHLYSKNIDPDNIVTLSRPWIQLLRQQVKYQGLILSDSRTFFNDNKQDLDKQVERWLKRHPEDSPQVAFIAKTIIAGHDMVLIQGVARDTIKLFESLATMACRDDQDGARLRYRIDQSYNAIANFKKANKGALSYRPTVDPLLIGEVLAYKYKLDNRKNCRLNQADSFEFSRLRQKVFDVH